MRPRDGSLVAAALAGDGNAFADLIERHRPRLGALVFALLGDREETEDVVQETLLRAFVGLPTLRDPERFGAWLGTIAVNLARMRRRRPRRETVPLQELFADARDEIETGLPDALAALSRGTQELLLMHYVEGASCAEIGERLGLSAGAVRVRLHRARGRLRSLVPILTTERGTGMIEVTLEDVYVRVVAEEPPRLAEERMRIAVLREQDGGRRLPIWIGPAEGDALTVLLRGEALPRPLTVDLTVSLLAAVGAKIERVVVSRLEERTFFAIVAVRAGGETREVDARPSDAMNLAVRTGAPIFVDEALMEGAGVVGEDAAAVLDQEAQKPFEGYELPAGEWRPHSLELLTSFWNPQRK